MVNKMAPSCHFCQKMCLIEKVVELEHCLTETLEERNSSTDSNLIVITCI